MRPFNLERIKAGDPVITRDGRKARYIGSYNGKIYKHVFIIPEADGTEVCLPVTDAGSPDHSYYIVGRILMNDLFMAPVKTGWANIHAGGYVSKIYDSEEEAVKNFAFDAIQTVRITWEDQGDETI